jgi:polar amino acid transport system substrate-binding protein
VTHGRGHEGHYPPFEFVQDGQAGPGWILISTSSCKDWAGLPVRQEILPWQGLLAGVVSGQFDRGALCGDVQRPAGPAALFMMPSPRPAHTTCKRKGVNRILSVKDPLRTYLWGMQQGSSIHQRIPR